MDTDWQTFYQLEDDIISGKEVDLISHFGSVSRNDLQKLIDLQNTAENDLYQNSDSLSVPRQELTLIQDALAEVGINHYAPFYGQFRQQLTQAVVDQELMQKRSLTREEKQRLIYAHLNVFLLDEQIY